MLDTTTLKEIQPGYTGATIASATTTDLSAATGDVVTISGTTTITGLGTVSAGIQMVLIFSGALTLTHNATSLIIPGGASITTVAGDSCRVVSLGSGNWRLLTYTPVNSVITGYSAETKFCTTQFDAVTGTTGTTLTNIVGLTGFTLAAAGTYRYEIFLNGVATANCGHKIGFKYTTATLTSLNNGSQALLAATTAYTQSTSTTDQASLHAATTATLGIVLRGRLVVATGGTLAIQAAQNAAHADTTSVYVGSWGSFVRIS